MTKRSISDLLAKAEEHFRLYEWDEALVCFEQVLQEAPTHGGAQQGVRDAKKQIAADSQIREMVDGARTAIADQSYEAAVSALDQAHTLSAQRNILKHIAEIDGLRAEVQERLRWQHRVASEVAEARRLAADHKPEAALQKLDVLLRDLAETALSDLGDEARHEQEKLLQGIEFEDKLQRAQEYFYRQDFQAACRLASELEAQTAQERMARDRLKRDACSAWEAVARDLRQAEQALDDDRLDDAAALLGQLRASAPDNPDWKGLWLKGYDAHGQNSLEKGRQALQRRDFQNAKDSFDQARSAFKSVLDVFPAHKVAEPARNIADALFLVTVEAAHAILERNDHRWEASRQSVLAARDKLGVAEQTRGGPFPDVGAVLTAILGEVQSIIEAIGFARACLQEGEAKYQDHRPDEAEHRFREGLERVNDHDPDLQGRLIEGIRRAEHLQEDVKRLLERATNSEDIDQRLALLADAHGLWPGAPGMPDVWVDAVLKAGKQALLDGCREKASESFTLVLSIPDVSAAKQDEARIHLRNLGAEMQVSAALKQAREMQTAATSAPLPKLESFQQVVDILRAAASDAAGASDAAKRKALDDMVTPALAEAEDQFARIHKALLHSQEAESLRRQGEWGQAVQELTQAVECLGSLQASQLRSNLSEWQRFAEEAETKLKAASDAYGQAHGHYQAGSNGDLAAIPWPELRKALEKAEMALAERPDEHQPLPAGWQRLVDQVADLRRRATLLQEVHDQVRMHRMQEALSRLRAASEAAPEDVVVAAIGETLHAEFRGEMEAESQRLLADAQERMERGEMEESLELLRQARQLEPTAEVKKQLDRLERQNRLWGEVVRLDLDGTAKRQGNSLEEAIDAFERALRKAMEVDAGLPIEVRSTLADLISTSGNLHKADIYQRSMTLREELQSFALQYPIIQQRLINTVRSWHDLSIKHARAGFITSRIGLDKLEEAYAEAVRFVSDFPLDPNAGAAAADARRRFRDQLLNSSVKRLGYARELADKGAYAEAQSALADIENRWLGSASRNFPEMLENDPDIERLRADAADLSRRLNRLQGIANQVEPLIGKIRSAYVDGDQEAARTLIAEAETLDRSKEAALLWNEIDGLRFKIEAARQQSVRDQVGEALQRADVAMELGHTAARLEPILERLAMLRTPMEQSLNSGEDEELRRRFAEVTAKTQIRLNELRGVEKAQEKAQAALAVDALEELRVALNALRRAEQTARGAELEQVQTEIDRFALRIKVKEGELLAQEQEQERRRKQIDAWDATLAAFEQRKWDDAERLLAEARKLGKAQTETQPYMDAVRAGRRLDSALAQEKAAPDEAKRLLLQALAETEGCQPAAPLRAEAERHLVRIESLLEEQKEASKIARERDRKIAKLLRDAESSFRQGENDKARATLDELFQLDSENAKAGELMLKLDQAAQAEGLLERATVLRQEEHYENALGLVEQALDLSPYLVAARQLKQQLETEREAGIHLVRARSLAAENQFAVARLEISQARELYASHPRLETVQEEIRRSEDRFREKQLRPIEEARHRKDYRKAVQLSEQLLSQAGSTDLREEVQSILRQIIDQWASDLSDRLEAGLREARMPDDLGKLAALRDEAREVLKLSPPPSGNWPRLLSQNITEIESRRLRQRLAEGRLAVDSAVKASEAGQQGVMSEYLAVALAIGEEVASEASTLTLTPITIESSRFNQEINRLLQQEERRRKEEERQRRQSQRDQALATARQQRETAVSLAMLEAARQTARQALAVEGFADDSEAKEVVQQIEQDIRQYHATEAALKEARQHLRRQSYDQAMRLTEASPLSFQRAEVVRLLGLIDTLYSASRRELGDPEGSLAIYLSAAQNEPDLAATLEPAIKRCRETLLDRALADVNAWLDAPIPSHEAALAKLQKALDAGWVTQARQREVQELQTRAKGLALTALAASGLAERGDADEALVLLAQVRQQTPDGRLDPLSAGWEAAARATQAATRARATLAPTDIAEAERWTREVPDMLASQKAVQTLRLDVSQLRELATAMHAAEAGVQAALDASPPDYARAVDIARRSQSLVNPPHPRALAQVDMLRDALQREIEKRRVEGQEYYDEIPTFIALLLKLLPDDPLPAQLTKEVETERSVRLDMALKQADSALAADKLEAAQQSLARARALSGQTQSKPLTTLAEKLQRRSMELEQVAESITRARQAWSNRQFEQAVVETVATIRLAPKYDLVVKWASDLSESLTREVHQLKDLGHYSEALSLCNLGLGLGNNELLGTLQKEVKDALDADQERKKDLANTAFDQALAALAILDLDAADHALALAQGTIADDPRFPRLADRLQSAHNKAPKLKQEMENGWEQLALHSFEQALASFQKAMLNTPDGVAEPENWRKYTDNIIKGVDLVKQQQHQSAADNFAEAEKCLRISALNSLPILWSERLRNERRRGAYYAFRLREEVQGIADDRKRARDLGQVDPLAAAKVLRDVIARQEQFGALVMRALEPPADFDDSAPGSTRPTLTRTHAKKASRSESVPAPAQQEDLAPTQTGPAQQSLAETLAPPALEPAPTPDEAAQSQKPAQEAPPASTAASSFSPPESTSVSASTDVSIVAFDYDALLGGLDVSLPPLKENKS